MYHHHVDLLIKGDFDHLGGHLGGDPMIKVWN